MMLCVADCAEQITSVYLKLNETQRAANALSTILVRWPVSSLTRKTACTSGARRGAIQCQYDACGTDVFC